jgi:predicted  nucleic acid-binding Zn-ribbon protein
MARKMGKSSNTKTDKALRTLGQRLDKLIGQAKRTEREVETRYAKQIRALRLKQALAKRAVQKLRRRSAAAAPPLKSGLQRAWADLNDAVKQAAARFRKTS